MGRARGHVSLCRLVIVFVTITVTVGPVRRQGPQRPAAVEALVAPKLISAWQRLASMGGEIRVSGKQGL